MMSLSFMISSSWPSSLTSVPATCRTGRGRRLEVGSGSACRLRRGHPGHGGDFALRGAFSLALSGMMMPPAVFSSASMRLTHNAVVKRTEFHAVLLSF